MARVALKSVVLGMLGAMLVVAQVSLAFLPNIELVSLLILLYARMLGKWVFVPVSVFVLVEGLIYGFGLWWINYLYVWPTLALVAFAFRGNKGLIWPVMLNGAFGLLFGSLCALPYLFIGGPASALAYWISGIPFDLLHALGNVCAALLLFKPLLRVCERFLMPLFDGKQQKNIHNTGENPA